MPDVDTSRGATTGQTVVASVVGESVEGLVERAVRDGLRGRGVVERVLRDLPNAEAIKKFGVPTVNVLGQVLGALSASAIDKLKIDAAVKRLLKMTIPHVVLGAGEGVGDALAWESKVHEATIKARQEFLSQPDERARRQMWHDEIGAVGGWYARVVAKSVKEPDYIDEMYSVPVERWREEAMFAAERLLRGTDKPVTFTAEGEFNPIAAEQMTKLPERLSPEEIETAIRLIFGLGEGKLDLRTEIGQFIDRLRRQKAGEPEKPFLPAWLKWSAAIAFSVFVFGMFYVVWTIVHL